MATSSDEALDEDKIFAQRFWSDQGGGVLDHARVPEVSHSLPHLTDRNALLKEVASTSWLGRMLMNLVVKAGCQGISKGPSYQREVRMVEANVENLPLRTLVLFSKGALSFEFLDALIAAMKGKVIGTLAGFVTMIACWFSHKAAKVTQPKSKLVN